MKLFKQLLELEPQKKDRRRDSVERARRQHQIEEENRKRIQTLRPDLGLLGFW